MNVTLPPQPLTAQSNVSVASICNKEKFQKLSSSLEPILKTKSNFMLDNRALKTPMKNSLKLDQISSNKNIGMNTFHKKTLETKNKSVAGKSKISYPNLLICPALLLTLIKQAICGHHQ